MLDPSYIHRMATQLYNLVGRLNQVTKGIVSQHLMNTRSAGHPLCEHDLRVISLLIEYLGLSGEEKEEEEAGRY